MLNDNSFKTALLFLGIIFLAILIRSFVAGDSIFVQSSEQNQSANIGCSVSKGTC